MFSGKRSPLGKQSVDRGSGKAAWFSFLVNGELGKHGSLGTWSLASATEKIIVHVDVENHGRMSTSMGRYGGGLRRDV
jgi:hypothetical protein